MKEIEPNLVASHVLKVPFMTPQQNLRVDSGS